MVKVRFSRAAAIMLEDTDIAALDELLRRYFNADYTGQDRVLVERLSTEHNESLKELYEALGG